MEGTQLSKGSVCSSEIVSCRHVFAWQARIWSRAMFTTIFGMGLALVGLLFAVNPAWSICVSNQGAATNASFGIECLGTSGCTNIRQGFSFPVTSCDHGIITQTRIRFENAVAGKRFRIFLWRNNANGTPNDICIGATQSEILTLPADGSVLYEYTWGRAQPGQCFHTEAGERIHIGVTYVDDSLTEIDWEIGRQDNASGSNFGYVNFAGTQGGWNTLSGQGYAGDRWGVENIIEDRCNVIPDPNQSTWSWLGPLVKNLCPQGDGDEVQVDGMIRDGTGAPIPDYRGEFICLDCDEVVGCGSGPDSTCATDSDINGIVKIRFNEAGYNSEGYCTDLNVELEGNVFRTFLGTKVRFFDLNGDCFVDAADLAMLAAHMGTAPDDLFADFDNDGVVCALDADVMEPHLGHSGFAPGSPAPAASGPSTPIDLSWQIDGSGPWTGDGPPPPSWSNGLLLQGQGTPGPLVDVGPTMKMVRWSGLTLTGSNAELGDVTLTVSPCGCLTLIESLSPTGTPFYPATQTNYFFCTLESSLPAGAKSGTNIFSNTDPIKLVAQVNEFPSPATFDQQDAVKLFDQSNPARKIQFNDSELVEPGVTATADAPSVAPVLQVAPWSPSPFGGTTELHYELAQGAPVSLSIYDAQGRLRRQLADGAINAAGSHKLVWDGTDNRGLRLPSGRYFYRLDAGLVGRHTGVVTILR